MLKRKDQFRLVFYKESPGKTELYYLFLSSIVARQLLLSSFNISDPHLISETLDFITKLNKCKKVRQLVLIKFVLFAIRLNGEEDNKVLEKLLSSFQLIRSVACKGIQSHTFSAKIIPIFCRQFVARLLRLTCKLPRKF